MPSSLIMKADLADPLYDENEKSKCVLNYHKIDIEEDETESTRTK